MSDSYNKLLEVNSNKKNSMLDIRSANNSSSNQNLNMFEPQSLNFDL